MPRAIEMHAHEETLPMFATAASAAEASVFFHDAYTVEMDVSRNSGFVTLFAQSIAVAGSFRATIEANVIRALSSSAPCGCSSSHSPANLGFCHAIRETT